MPKKAEFAANLSEELADKEDSGNKADTIWVGGTDAYPTTRSGCARCIYTTRNKNWRFRKGYVLERKSVK